MKKSLLLLNTLILFSFINIFSQNVEFEKSKFEGRKKEFNAAIDQISDADKILEKNPDKIKEALDLYLKANSFNPNNAMLNYKIGSLHMKSYDKLKAIPYLEKAYALKKEVMPDLIFLLGEAYHYNLELSKAISAYKEAKQNFTATQLWDEKKGDLTDRKIFECQTGLIMLKNKLSCRIENAGNIINSGLNEFNPLINADGTMLIFNAGKTNYSPYPAQNSQSNILISYKNNGEWSMPVNAGETLNFSEDNEVVGMSPDGLKLLLCYENGRNGKDLYESSFDGTKWTKPKNMGDRINSKFNEISACYSTDGNTLYFVSNRTGSTGGSYDIYMSSRTSDKKEEWSAASGVGAIINTKYDEISVSADCDGKTLYFCSNAHTTIGGFDIFKTVLTEKGWSEPENIGYPINTPFDETSFSVTARGKHAFYSTFSSIDKSNTDINKITFAGIYKQIFYSSEVNLLSDGSDNYNMPNKEVVVDNYSKHLTVLEGIISDESTQQPLHATIVIKEGIKNVSNFPFESNPKTGKYLTVLPSGGNYVITFSSDKYLPGSYNINIPDTLLYREVFKDIKLKK